MNSPRFRSVTPTTREKVLSKRRKKKNKRTPEKASKKARLPDSQSGGSSTPAGSPRPPRAPPTSVRSNPAKLLPPTCWLARCCSRPISPPRSRRAALTNIASLSIPRLGSGRSAGPTSRGRCHRHRHPLPASHPSPRGFGATSSAIGGTRDDRPNPRTLHDASNRHPRSNAASDHTCGDHRHHQHLVLKGREPPPPKPHMPERW